MDGSFWSRFNERQKYGQAFVECIRQSVERLSDTATTPRRPGVLLGKIQSGKTRTFLGIIALAFDNGFEVAVVLTKGTVALAEQTLERLRKDFEGFIEADEMQVFDVMHMPERLSPYERNQKLVIVCKKEDDNIRRLEKVLLGKENGLRDRKILVVDDEADLASVGFKRTKAEGLQVNKIAGQLDKLRGELTDSATLQVTATPYSLYLQPETIEAGPLAGAYRPVRPAFTVLVPVHESYVGGDVYSRQSLEPDSVASFLFKSVPQKELGNLAKPDRRSFKIEEVLTSNAMAVLRQAVVSFVVGGTIRRLQARANGEVPLKYSFIVHTERKKAAHDWQEEVVEELVAQLQAGAASGSPRVVALVEASYADLSQSILKGGLQLPNLEEVQAAVRAEIATSVMVTKVNSENDMRSLLDKSGQLKLRTPLSIFIGGQILDRGITIANLIGFYYGRDPQVFQQDTVLQHSRMYGARPQADLAVTRFYTTNRIFLAMYTMNAFDGALRESFEQNGPDAEVVFIQKDAAERVIPCSPNKILISETTTLRPGSRYLPIGFQTLAKTNLAGPMKKMDEILAAVFTNVGEDDPVLIDVDLAADLVRRAGKLYDWEYPDAAGEKWDEEAFIAAMKYSAGLGGDEEKGHVWLLVRRGRSLKRVRAGGRFQNSPDTPHVEGKIAEKYAKNVGMLMLFELAGSEEDGWRGGRFFWPVLRLPAKMRTLVYASETSRET